MESYLEAYKNKRVLITGGLGFIGSNLAHKLVSIGDVGVILVDSLNPRYGGNPFNIHEIKSAVQVNVFDMNETEKMSNLVEGMHYIFNLAGQVSHADSMTDPHADLDANCRAHLSLLEACRKRNATARIVYTSTRQIYGRPRYLPVDEDHPRRPTDINGIHKMMCEEYHSLYQQVHGIETVSLRLTNTYGPRQFIKDPRQGFLGWFIRKAIDGEEISIFGTGNQLRDLTYVDDVSDAILRAGAAPDLLHSAYNIGGLEYMSVLEFTKRLISITGRGNYRVIPFPSNSKLIDVGDYYADYGRMKSELGWTPRVTVEEGILRTVRFYEAHRDQYWE